MLLWKLKILNSLTLAFTSHWKSTRELVVHGESWTKYYCDEVANGFTSMSAAVWSFCLLNIKPMINTSQLTNVSIWMRAANRSAGIGGSAISSDMRLETSSFADTIANQTNSTRDTIARHAPVTLQCIQHNFLFRDTQWIKCKLTAQNMTKYWKQQTFLGFFSASL